MTITVRSGDDTIHVCAFGERADRFAWPGSGTPVVAWIDDFDLPRAVLFVRRYFGGVDGIDRLRSLLARDTYDVCRLTDGEVIDAAASKLARRMWHAGRQTGTIPGIAPPAVRPRAGASASTRRSAAPRPAPAAQAARAAAEPVPASAAQTPDWLDATDQVAQADTLEQAARSGTPFCEVCERAARQRQAAEAVDG